MAGVDDFPVDMSEQLYEPLAAVPPPVIPIALPAYVAPDGYAVAYAPSLLKKPRIWTGFVAFATYLLLTIGVGVAVIVAQVAITGQMQITTEFVLGIMAFNVIVAGCVAVGAARFSSEPALERLQLKPAGMTLLSTLVGIITTCSIGVVFTAGVQLLSRAPLGNYFDSPNLLTGISPKNPGVLALGYLIIAFGAGIGEELLFRGYMQSRFVKRMGFYGALFTTAGLFGLAHGNLVQSPFAFVMGLFVGHLAYRTGSILPAMVCHSANNAMAVTLSTFGLLPEATEAAATLLVISLATTAIGWLVMVRLTRPRVPVAVSG